jgi:predicted nucleic acid-binding OB-fold protein
MLIPEYVLKDLSVGSGSIIGKDNIEELFNHVSRHNDIEDRSLAELAPSYEIVTAYLVHMLEAKFVNLNPIIQQMFLKLHDVEDTKKRDFILKTLRKEFRDVVIEARKKLRTKSYKNVKTKLQKSRNKSYKISKIWEQKSRNKNSKNLETKV